MDTTKQNQTGAAQDADDLIAELARLVAQDARSSSANSDAYRRAEPRIEPEPAFEAPAQVERQLNFPDPDVSSPSPHEGYVAVEENYPSTYTQDERYIEEPYARAAAPLASEGSDFDPIADLIASADAEEFASDEPQDEDDRFFAAPGPGAPYGDSDGWTEQQASAIDENVHADAPVYAASEPEPHYPSQNWDIPTDKSAVADERDPLGDIEALIGEAARVSATASLAAGRRVKSSYLDGQQEPQFSAPQDAGSSAEAAILEAAATAGARVERIEPGYQDEYRAEPEAAFVAAEPAPSQLEEGGYEEEFDEQPAYATRRPRRLSGLVVPVAAGALIVALMGGGYFYFFGPSQTSGDAPVLTADGGPIRQDVEQVSTPTTANQSVVFNELEGNVASPDDEALVSRDQTDGATGADVGRVVAPEEGEILLANRPVRTVTVRPDGTIVMADDGVAGSNVLPVDRPDVPSVPNSTLTADPIGEAIASAMAGTDIEPMAMAIETPAASEIASEVSLPDASTPEPVAPVETSAAAEASVTTEIPRPIPRPTGLAGTAVPTPPIETPPQSVAAVSPTPAPEPAPSAAAPSSVGAWVQLSSQRSEDVARAGMAELQSRYGSLFNGTALEVSRVDLGERGIYYRVRLPQPTMSDANAICNAIKGQGGDCFVLNN